jgi:hypothetical protein
MKLVKIQLLFKTNDLILFISAYSNKVCKLNSYLGINYRIKISLLVLLHIYSINKLLLIPFIESTLFILSYGYQTYKKLINIALTLNSSICYAIKFNNKFYPLTIVKCSYLLSYTQVQKLLYKTLSNIVKKTVKIM